MEKNTDRETNRRVYPTPNKSGYKVHCGFSKCETGLLVTPEVTVNSPVPGRRRRADAARGTWSSSDICFYKKCSPGTCCRGPPFFPRTCLAERRFFSAVKGPYAARSLPAAPTAAPLLLRVQQFLLKHLSHWVARCCCHGDMTWYRRSASDQSLQNKADFYL